MQTHYGSPAWVSVIANLNLKKPFSDAVFGSMAFSGSDGGGKRLWVSGGDGGGKRLWGFFPANLGLSGIANLFPHNRPTHHHYGNRLVTSPTWRAGADVFGSNRPPFVEAGRWGGGLNG